MTDPATAMLAAGAGIVGSKAVDTVIGTDANIIRLLESILAQSAATAHFSRVQRERTLYPINVNPGITYSIPGMLRLEYLFSSGAPGDELALRLGTSNLFSWVNVSGDPLIIPFPLLLTGDISVVNITDSTDTTYRATIFADRDA